VFTTKRYQTDSQKLTWAKDGVKAVQDLDQSTWSKGIIQLNKVNIPDQSL